MVLIGKQCQYVNSLTLLYTLLQTEPFSFIETCTLGLKLKQNMKDMEEEKDFEGKYYICRIYII